MVSKLLLVLFVLNISFAIRCFIEGLYINTLINFLVGMLMLYNKKLEDKRRDTGYSLKQKGYTIKVLNLVEKEKGNPFNPLNCDGYLWGTNPLTGEEIIETHYRLCFRNKNLGIKEWDSEVDSGTYYDTLQEAVEMAEQITSGEDLEEEWSVWKVEQQIDPNPDGEVYEEHWDFVRIVRSDNQIRELFEKALDEALKLCGYDYSIEEKFKEKNYNNFLANGIENYDFEDDSSCQDDYCSDPEDYYRRTVEWFKDGIKSHEDDWLYGNEEERH